MPALHVVVCSDAEHKYGPHEHIRDAFLDLDDKAPDSVHSVMDYVYITWIRNNVYPIRNWSIFMLSIRTNNDVEGWHNNLNSRVSSRGPVPFYLLVNPRKRL
jgi:hypothetical protein